MQVIHETAFNTVELHDEGVVVVRRTRTPYPSVEEFRRGTHEMFALLESTPGVKGVVIDSRQSIGRNDDDFEAAARDMQREVLARVPRMAVVMKSAVGLLQANRMTSDRASILATTDESEAIAFASAG